MSFWSLKTKFLMTGYRMSGYKCWRCWWGNEWAEVKTGSGPSERVTGQDGGGFYQLCALWCLLADCPLLPVCLCFTALTCSSLAASILVDLERIFFTQKFSKGSVAAGASVPNRASPVQQHDWFYWPVFPFHKYADNCVYIVQ